MTDPAGQGCQPYTALPVGNTSNEAGGKSGKLVGLVLHPAAAACSAKVYAGQVAGTNLIAELAGAASGSSIVLLFTQHTPMYANGWTITVAGAGATADVFTKPLN